MNSKANRKLAIILIGPPGSGKGTQAELLAEELNLYHFETSKVIERNVMKAKKGDFLKINGIKYPLVNERKLWLNGSLCSASVITFWAKKEIQEIARLGKNLISCSFPRDVEQAEKGMPFLEKLYGKENIKIIEILLSPKQTIWRNQRRRICKLMRHSILSTRQEFLKLSHCPLDGSKLVKRKGLDNPKIIIERLKTYKEETLPLIDYLKRQGFKVEKVNGDQSVEGVFKDILKAIK